MGAPKIDLNIVDQSSLPSSAAVGVIGFMGVTERGPVRPTLVGSWEEFVDIFGGLISEDLFPLYAKRALEGGSKLMVSRVVHYADITDISSVVGTKATLVKNQASPVAEVRASGTITLTAGGAVGNEVTAVVLAANGLPIVLGKATAAVSETPTTLAAKLVTAINLLTGSHGYTATSAAGVVTAQAPVGSGATPNGYVFAPEVTGSITYTSTAFASGVTAQGILVLTIDASDIGAWGNNLRASAVPAASGTSGLFDLTISLVGNSRVTTVITDVPANPTADQIASYNAVLTLVKIVSITTLSAFSASAFTGGVEDKALIREIDYIGDSSAGNGLYAFDEEDVPVKITAPALVDPVFDIALAMYVDNRKDLIGLIRTPIGVTAQGAVDYRKGTGAYNHSPINSWRMLMFTGGLRVTHPVTGLEIQIGETGDIAYIATNKDNNQFAWSSMAGPVRGLIKNALGVVKNFGSPSKKAAFDQISAAGVNAVIKDKDYGTVLWDNVTLSTGNTILRHANVAELLIYLYRAIIPLAKSEMFNPNDVDTWKSIYRKVERLMTYVQDNKGVFEWKYVGDQEAETVAQAVLNTSITVDQGIYKFRLYIKPTPSMREVAIDVIVTNSDVDFSLVG